MYKLHNDWYRSIVNGKENAKNIVEGFDYLHIILLIHAYALIKMRQFNRKYRLKMRGTTPEAAMLADIIESHSAISSVYQCVTTGPL